MEIYIMRHGETVWNAKGIIQGRSNNRLSKNGKEQVKKQAEELKDIKFDYIFASPLMRTMQTANIINTYHHNKIIKDNRIIEIDQGKFSNRKKSTLNDEEKEILKKREDTRLIESFDMVQNRVDDFISYIKSNFNNKTILVVTHGYVAKSLYLTLLKNGISTDGIDVDLFNNAEVKKVII